MQGAELFLFVPSLLFFATTASYLDFRYRKIPNALVVRILAVSVILNSVFFSDFTNSGKMGIFFAFVIVSALISLLLWLVDFWKPGDVKFYTAMSTLIHPTSSSQFLTPLLCFLILSIAATVLEALVTRKFEFRPRFSPGMLLPVVISPFMASLGVSAFPIFFMLFFLGQKLEKLKVPIAAAALVAFLMSPARALQALASTFTFFLVSSIRFKGHLPSAPFISASFIYLLVWGGI